MEIKMELRMIITFLYKEINGNIKKTKKIFVWFFINKICKTNTFYNLCLFVITML